MEPEARRCCNGTTCPETANPKHHHRSGANTKAFLLCAWRRPGQRFRQRPLRSCRELQSDNLWPIHSWTLSCNSISISNDWRFGHWWHESPFSFPFPNLAPFLARAFFLAGGAPVVSSWSVRQLVSSGAERLRAETTGTVGDEEEDMARTVQWLACDLFLFWYLGAPHRALDDDSCKTKLRWLLCMYRCLRAPPQFCFATSRNNSILTARFRNDKGTKRRELNSMLPVED